MGKVNHLNKIKTTGHFTKYVVTEEIFHYLSEKKYRDRIDSLGLENSTLFKDENWVWKEYGFLVMCQYIEFQAAELLCLLDGRYTLKKILINDEFSFAKIINKIENFIKDLVVNNIYVDKIKDKDLIMNFRNFKKIRNNYIHKSFIGGGLKKIIENGRCLGSEILEIIDEIDYMTMREFTKEK